MLGDVPVAWRYEPPSLFLGIVGEKGIVRRWGIKLLPIGQRTITPSSYAGESCCEICYAVAIWILCMIHATSAQYGMTDNWTWKILNRSIALPCACKVCAFRGLSRCERKIK